MPTAKKKQRYHGIKQKKNLCGPTCLQMVLFRRGVWVDQEALAARLDLKIEERDRHLYMLPLEAAPDNDLSCVGIKLPELENSRAKNTLEMYDLVPKAHFISKIADPHSFLIDNLEEDHDIMANFFWGPINGRQNGHYALVCDYDKEKKEITLCDPSTEQKSFWKCHLDKLTESMHKRWTGEERGFVVVKQKEKE